MNRDTSAISPASCEETASVSRAIASDDQNPRAAARQEHDLLAAIAGLFVNDSFAEEVDAYIQAERQRERDEAADLLQCDHNYHTHTSGTSTPRRDAQRGKVAG